MCGLKTTAVGRKTTVGSQRSPRLAPLYRTGGVNEDATFFGRRKILSHIVHRKPANYLIAGGRQLGKTSLLKAVERHYRDHPRIRCHYLSLYDDNLSPSLAHVLALPRDSDLEEICTHIEQTQGRRPLLLIDEADLFVATDQRRDFPAIRRLRSLSDNGHAHFILAGFWSLYRAARLDVASPLRNFGEMLVIGGLEEAACRRLAIHLVELVGVGYECPEVVDLLVRETGRRANLIRIACNEIRRRLDPQEHTARKAHVTMALRSPAVKEAMASWGSLGGRDHEASRLDRNIVYATVDRERFTLAQVIELLEGHGLRFRLREVERSLERLTLAFVLGQEGERYFFQVPLFKKMILERNPRELLEMERLVARETADFGFVLATSSVPTSSFETQPYARPS